MDTLKNSLIFVLLIVLLILLPLTVYLGKSYFTLSAQIESTEKNKITLNQAAIDSNTFLTQKLDEVGQTFMNNRYLLSNQTPTTKVDIKAICVQENGINCIYNKEGKLEYLGNHEAF
ncbi:hypothetical protein [Cysteiniphilum halobium]|uniref:hypothetical protein n=1 Tax=Cysteiniphilum halobium TaxID=2219059 RepID=UPI003F87A1A7